ncbi:ATP-binding protein [Streptomyces massasporeus]
MTEKSPTDEAHASIPAPGTPEPAFDVICIPIGEYEEHQSLDADGEASQVVRLLNGLGGRDIPWNLPEGTPRDIANVHRRLRSWCEFHEPRSSMLFWVGHGESTAEGAWLAAHDSPGTIRIQGIRPENLADAVEAEWATRRSDPGAWAIIFIEACGAARFARLLRAKLDSSIAEEPVCGFAAIGVGADDGPANLGQFRRVLEDVLSEESKAYSDNDAEIKPMDLLRQLQERLRFGGEVADVRMHKLHQARGIPRRKRLMTTVTAPIDVYDELRKFIGSFTPEERRNLLPKIPGIEQGDLAWRFIGREHEQNLIASWMRTHTQGILVITGPAGVGKSALLGHALIETTHGLRDKLVEAGRLPSYSKGAFDDTSRFDAVIHLTGMTTGRLLTRLALAAGLGEPPKESRIGQDIEWLLDSLSARRGPFTVMLDALDEAQEPAAIASTVLRRLTDVAQVRLIVGTRASTREGPDLPHTADTNILEALGPTADVLTIQRDADAIGHYVRLRLTEAGLQGFDRAIDEVAQLIQRENREFLYARLAVCEIIADPHLLGSTRRDQLVDLLSRDHRALFANAVRRLTRAAPPTGPLLEALAMARGRGLPRVDGVWATIATALHEGELVREPDIDHLVQAAAPYVMLDVEHDQSVYRLAHRTFADHFLTRPEA